MAPCPSSLAKDNCQGLETPWDVATCRVGEAATPATLLTDSEQKPGPLLTVLRGTGQPPAHTTQKDLAREIQSAEEESPCLKACLLHTPSSVSRGRLRLGSTSLYAALSVVIGSQGVSGGFPASKGACIGVRRML